ncbi:MAG: DUF192 domain-containing protein [Elusimicrobia bacterium]|nr:DUF192 domain-containing protein [Elusimicrobiota bacterium]
MILAALALSLSLNASAASPKKKAAPACVPQKVPKKAKLTFPDGKTILANVVDTPASRETGMMCLAKVKRDYGMLFVFPNEMDLNFWMKNTLLSLDIVWIGADKKVTVVHDHMKKSTVSTPDDKVATAFGRGLYVLELPAGAAARHKLKAGDALTFDVELPKL